MAIGGRANDVGESNVNYNAGHVKVFQYTTTPSITQNKVTITGNTLTDGTANLASGALTGNVIGTVFGELIGNVTATTMTDGTATLASGTLTTNCIQYDDTSIIQGKTLTLVSGTISWNQLGDDIDGDAAID